MCVCVIKCVRTSSLDLIVIIVIWFLSCQIALSHVTDGHLLADTSIVMNSNVDGVRWCRPSEGPTTI